MGRREMGLIFILFCSTSIATSFSIFSTEKHDKDGITNRIGRRYIASATAVANRVGHGSSAGGGGGGGDGSGSRPHTGGGGTAIIPIYAAGSAQARRHQGRPRNAGYRHENNMVLLVATVLAAIAHMYRVL